MFYTTTITPQVYDTDMQGHVNYLSPQLWFDRARSTIYRQFEPNMDFSKHCVVTLKVEVTYIKEIMVAADVEIRTWTSALGNKSYEITQEAWQNGERCVVAKSIFCGFDFTTHKSEPLSERFRAVLEQYRYAAE